METEPPTLTGLYITTGMQTYNATGSLKYLINNYLNSVFRLTDQNGGNISFQEQISSNLYSTGNGCYITGEIPNFTIWMSNSNSDGSKTCFVLSGTLESGNLTNCKSLTVYTNQGSSSYNAGDWYAAQGDILHYGGYIYGKWTQITSYPNGDSFTFVIIFNNDGTWSEQIVSNYGSSRISGTFSLNGIWLSLKTYTNYLNSYDYVNYSGTLPYMVNWDGTLWITYTNDYTQSFKYTDDDYSLSMMVGGVWKPSN